MFSFLRTKFLKLKNKWQNQNMQPIAAHSYDIKLLQKIKGKFWPRFSQLKQIGRIFNSQEKTIMKICLLFLVAGIFWAGTNWVRARRVLGPAVGGTVVEAVVGSPQFINPIYSVINDVDADISRLVYSGLMHYDKKGRLLPDLAVKYNISPDKKTYTFTLRQDVYWHDGEHFTANDVAYTVEAIQNVLAASPLYLSFQGVKVEVIDDYTVAFHLTESYAPFLSSLTVGILPEHVWFNTPPEQMRLAQTNIQPVGTGPFMFKKLTKDESGKIYSYELQRFERFYREPPFLQTFIFQFFTVYEGDAGAVQALRSQKVQSLSFVPKNLRDRIERKHINLKTLQLPQYTALFFNSNNEILKDKDLRLALSKATDKDRILKEALRGEGQVINSPVLPDFPGYNPELGKINYNLDEANKLLDKNWPRFSADDYKKEREKTLLDEWKKSLGSVGNASSTSGAVSSSEEIVKTEIKNKLQEELNEAQTFYRRDKTGKLLEVNLVTVGTDEYKQAAGLIVGFWQGIGVRVNVHYVAARDFSREVLKNRNYDILLYGEIVGSDPDQYPFWHSSQATFPGLNLSGYTNRNVDGILQKARESTDDNEKIALYKKFQEILLAEMPAIFLYTPTYTYALSDEVRGVDVNRISQSADRFADITSWYIKTIGHWNFTK